MTAPTVLDTPAAMRSWSDEAHRSGATIALVPTMGALHDGHLALIADAQERADKVVVSIFVNPMQFGEAADFEKYPRPIDEDLRACDELGVDVVFAPTSAAMYPTGFDTQVRVGDLALPMEGASRPGHFDGVATVVTKLFSGVRPDVAVFGQKDFQQLAIIRRMVVDLDLGVEIVGSPTVREHDGLALSSRNRRLAPDERAAAECVPLAIGAAIERAADPDSTVEDVIRTARTVVDDEDLATIDYVAVFDPVTLRPIETLTDDLRRVGSCRLAIAAFVGPVRLIDNDDLFGPG